jgi:H+-transporting ATPase
MASLELGELALKGAATSALILQSRKIAPSGFRSFAASFGHAVLTPFLQAISMLTNDFVTMSRAADRAPPSPYPNAWRVRNLTLAAVPLGIFRLLYLLVILSPGWFLLELSPTQLQTLTFAMLVFANQGNVYVLRERGRLWHSRPAPIMLVASACDVILVACLAAGGLLMSPLPIWLILLLLIATVGFTLAWTQ